MRERRTHPAALALLAALLFIGCSRAVAPAGAAPHHHQHHPPHGGTAIELGNEEYHIELVFDETSGTLQAYVLDAEMENFVRSPVPSIEISATVKGVGRSLVLAAVANPETGETVGDTSLFEAPAGWVKSSGPFDAVLNSITIRGSTFTHVRFNYPKGNDTDG
jgi:hypothetical protein